MGEPPEECFYQGARSGGILRTIRNNLSAWRADVRENPERRVVFLQPLAMEHHQGSGIVASLAWFSQGGRVSGVTRASPVAIEGHIIKTGPAESRRKTRHELHIHVVCSRVSCQHDSHGCGAVCVIGRDVPDKPRIYIPAGNKSGGIEF